MINKKEATKELVRMSLSYPMARYTVEELEIVAETWIESLVNVSPDVFKDACRLHREASDYFPTIKNILECCSGVWEERRRNIKKLPEPIPDLTPEEIKTNVQKVRDVMSAAEPMVASKPIKDLRERVRERMEKYKEKADG